MIRKPMSLALALFFGKCSRKSFLMSICPHCKQQLE
ncbi:hypothetical protein GLYMA_06G020201v4 [Glycine max]|nr:hypothetical protein GLYMA_06G020201v4 [Glycine max]KAH1123779.1 hypothetical protein GYH30_013825 [Glycine max]